MWSHTICYYCLPTTSIKAFYTNTAQLHCKLTLLVMVLEFGSSCHQLLEIKCLQYWRLHYNISHIQLLLCCVWCCLLLIPILYISKRDFGKFSLLKKQCSKYTINHLLNVIGSMSLFYITPYWIRVIYFFQRKISFSSSLSLQSITIFISKTSNFFISFI